jgi:hypothetical protein
LGLSTFEGLEAHVSNNAGWSTRLERAAEEVQEEGRGIVESDLLEAHGPDKQDTPTNVIPRQLAPPLNPTRPLPHFDSSLPAHKERYRPCGKA